MSCWKRMNPNDDVPAGASTIRSMSESGRARWRATEPKTASRKKPWSAARALRIGAAASIRVSGWAWSSWEANLKLLTDRWLCDAKLFGNLALGHPRCDHGAQSEDASEPCDFFVASGLAVLIQEGHKTTLSLGRGAA